MADIHIAEVYEGYQSRPKKDPDRRAKVFCFFFTKKKIPLPACQAIPG
jgi:hypothetical protein